MNKVETTIREALSALSSGTGDVRGVVNRLLGEDISAGDTVAIIDDPSYPYQGTKGKVKGVSAKGSGFLDVELPDGVVVPMQASLLLKCCK